MPSHTGDPCPGGLSWISKWFGRLRALARWVQRPPPLTVYGRPPEHLPPSAITVLQDELAPEAATEGIHSVLPGVPDPQRAQPKLRPTPKVRGRLTSTPILVTADSSSETEGSPVTLLPGPGEEQEIVTPARWPEREGGGEVAPITGWPND